VELRARIGLDVHNAWHEVESHNVVARIPGSDAARAAETVVYSAHWDHFGWRPQLGGPKSQQGLHGAQDNASGTAALLVLAAAFKGAAAAAGTLGAVPRDDQRGAGIARRPLLRPPPALPPARTRGGPETWTVSIRSGARATWKSWAWEVRYGRSRGGHGRRQQGRVAVPDAHPERGSFFRADQFEFARVGVPGLYISNGLDFIGKPPDYGEAKAQRIHRQSATTRWAT